MNVIKEEYHKYYSQYLNREMEMLVFGDGGYPVIFFPEAKGRYFSVKDNGFMEAAEHHLNEGKIKIYCPDSIDGESWYNYNIHPGERVKYHINYENMILNDVIGFAKYETGFVKVGVAGCNLGGYHALNLAFKHPDNIDSLITMGGTFNIKQFIMGFYDDNCYFNNPPDYLPGLSDPWYVDKFREMKIIMGIGEMDSSLNENKYISHLLNQKSVNHWFDMHQNAGHELLFWKEKFPQYLDALIKES